MGVHFELSDFPLEQQKKILKKFAEEDERKQSKQVVGNAPETPKSGGGKNKYHAEKVPTVLCDGTEHTFDSAKEYRRYSELELMQKAGEISNLRLQVPYEIIPKQFLSDGKMLRNCVYIADFVYEKDGKTVVEDVKGMKKNAAYNIFIIKKKLMKLVYDIEIIEI